MPSFFATAQRNTYMCLTPKKKFDPVSRAQHISKILGFDASPFPTYIHLIISALIRMGLQVLFKQVPTLQRSCLTQPACSRVPKSNRAMRKARRAFVKARKSCRQQAVSKSYNVSSGQVRSLTHQSTALRLAALAAQHRGMRITVASTSVMKTFEVSPEPVSDGELSKGTMAQIYRDFHNAWSSGMANVGAMDRELSDELIGVREVMGKSTISSACWRVLTDDFC